MMGAEHAPARIIAKETIRGAAWLKKYRNRRQGHVQLFPSRSSFLQPSWQKEARRTGSGYRTSGT